jgi:hypothetical protein
MKSFWLHMVSACFSAGVLYLIYMVHLEPLLLLLLQVCKA